MADGTVFRGITPLSPSKDVEKTIQFYFDVLGFKPNGYGGVIRGDVEILFYQTNDQKLAEWTSFRIHVQGVEQLYETYQSAGVVHPNGKLSMKPWGNLEFAIIDLDGVCITFFEKRE
ncbi:VOC family protein [Paenibacillus psychroresistens]|uniref:VOC family protein n=1 Tax=Paenibacillus psychroresistens TaxID=1778678 RepID=A0A6B8RFG4_9BACL|nr:VOC family protein [Paenibacillus psychroresistens]QGQ94677.1 VOC family protein [Paenibacillus psychroresistens]